mgnify:FL=1
MYLQFGGYSAENSSTYRVRVGTGSQRDIVVIRHTRPKGTLNQSRFYIYGSYFSQTYGQQTTPGGTFAYDDHRCYKDSPNSMSASIANSNFRAST